MMALMTSITTSADQTCENSLLLSYPGQDNLGKDKNFYHRVKSRIFLSGVQEQCYGKCYIFLTNTFLLCVSS